jgi:membrane associated rhomboid family serine protease
MWPRRGWDTLVMRWIALTLAASLLCVLGAGWLASWTALIPSRVLHGELWRLVTWPLIQLSPLTLMLTCVSIFKFGGELAGRWGDRRLQRFVIEVVIASATITCLLAALVGETRMVRIGGFAIVDALVIAWARQFPRAPLVLYGLLQVSGRQLIIMTIGAAVLIALYTSPMWMAPELVACAIAATYPGSRLARS